MSRKTRARRPPPRRRGPRPAQDVKSDMVEAATRVLTREGFAGTSARAVAREGGFDDALVLYHFGGLNGLLLAALDRSAEERLRRYRDALAGVRSPASLAEIAERIYREDLDGGHITLFSELIGASLSRPELAPEVVARADPWLELVAVKVDDVLEGTVLRDLVTSDDVAFAVIAFYLGVNLLAHLDDDRSRIDSLFGLVGRIAPLLSPIVSSPQ